MKLFKYEGYEVKVAPEALTLKPFKKLWDRDKSKDKEKALMELSFLYFYCDPSSDYQYIVDEDDRLEAVKEGIGMEKDWTPDKPVMDAIELYSSFDSPSAILLKTALIGIDKIQQRLKDVDLTEMDDKGKPVMSLKDYMAALKLVPELATSLAEAERSILQEDETGEAKGSIEKTLFDDGLDNV